VEVTPALEVVCWTIGRNSSRKVDSLCLRKYSVAASSDP
jgi:hypothetical protein